MEYIRWFLLSLVIFILAIVFIPIFIFRPFHPNNTWFAINILGPMAELILGFKIETENFEVLETEKPKVIVINHQSSLDFVVVGCNTPHKSLLIAKRSLGYIPLFGMLYWLTGHLFIDRKNHISAMRTMQKVKRKILKDNYSLLLMPEGTRNRGRGLRPFKKGAFRLALDLQIPIFPVVVSSYDEFVDLKRLKSGPVIMRALSPISTTGMSLAVLDNIMHTTRSVMAQEIEKLDDQLRLDVSRS